jgi:hypothetical protein
MRRLGTIVVAAVCIGVPIAARGGERDEALAVLNKAIQAHGGAEALDKAGMRSRSGKGIVALGGDTRLTSEETFHFPDRCRLVIDLESNRIVLVLNGVKGWTQAVGTTQEMSKETLREKQEELYVWWLMNLTPLLKDEFVLKPLADAKVNGQDAAVVKVSHRRYPDVRLFFDKKSNLLVKIARRSTETGVTLDKEYFYSDHREFDGVKMPTKEVVFLNGKTKMSEVTYNSYKVLPKVEDKLFEKP